MAQGLINGAGAASGMEVLLDINNGVDSIEGNLKNIYAYASGTVTKKDNGAYEVKYSSGGGTSSGNFELTIPTSYKGFVMRCSNSSIYELYVYADGVCSTNSGAITGTKILQIGYTSTSGVFNGCGYYSDTEMTKSICFGMAGKYGSRNVTQFDLEYLALLK